MMKIIAVWHGGVHQLTAWNNERGMAEALVSVVTDTEMRHSLWAFYRVDAEKYALIRAIPRLTWK